MIIHRLALNMEHGTPGLGGDLSNFHLNQKIL
jgi:hypothetical protein